MVPVDDIILDSAGVMPTATEGRVDMSAVFRGYKSGELVIYALFSPGVDVGDIAGESDLMVEAAYTWYGITPP